MPGSRTFENVTVGVLMVAVLLGGRAWIADVAHFGSVTIGVLVVLAVVVLYAFRRNFLAGGPSARLYATRDAAFLAGIAAAIAYVIAPARWSIGATVVGVEFGLIVQLLGAIREPSA